MGQSVSWVAVKGMTPQAVQNALTLRGTGTREQAVPESDITGTVLPGGWYLVVSQRDGLRLTEDATLNRLSGKAEVVMCFVEEHVMYSFAACWRDGQRIWSVQHDSEDGIESLMVKGQLPDSFTQISDKLFAEQAAAGGKKAKVDCIFAIPVEFAQSLTGYRYDEDLNEMCKDGFEVLVGTGPATDERPWWKRLFGA